MRVSISMIKTPWAKVTWRRKDLFWLEFLLLKTNKQTKNKQTNKKTTMVQSNEGGRQLFHPEVSKSRTGTAGTWRQELMHRSWRIAAYLLFLAWLVNSSFFSFPSFLFFSPRQQSWLFWNLLYSPGWPQTYWDPPTSASWVLGLKVWVPTAQPYMTFL